MTAPFFWKYIDHTQFLRLPLQAQAELAYILILGTVLPMYLLYRGTEKLTSVHTALYRYIQPVIAGILALVRGQAVFDAANIVALAFIFAGVVLVVIGYKYYVRHGLPPVGHDGGCALSPRAASCAMPRARACSTAWRSRRRPSPSGSRCAPGRRRRAAGTA